MYSVSNPRPSSDLFADASPSYLNGVNQCDTIVHSFHRILLAGNSNLNEAEHYYNTQQAHLQEQIQALDELQSAILEEKRCLESQLHECKTQVTQARNQKRVILTESDRLMQHLTQELAHLAEEEDQLQSQHDAVDDRVDEMKKLMAQLDEQFNTLNKEASELRNGEHQLTREERALEDERNELRQQEFELEERLVKAERQDESIALWTRNLDVRDSDAARVQQSILQRLREVESEERSVGLDTLTMFKMNPHHITVRAVLDDHDMSIERELDQEELDTDTDDGYSI